MTEIFFIGLFVAAIGVLCIIKDKERPGSAFILVGVMMMLFAGFGSVKAHDKWADGSPVPDWVQQYCCGPEDVHHYQFDEVRVTPDGYVLPDYPNVIEANGVHIHKSEDGEYWAFFSRSDDGRYSPIWCFFVPPGGA